MMKRIAILVALLAGLLSVWIYGQKRSVNAIRPPPGATNLVAFLGVRPPPNQILRFDRHGKVHIQIIGQPIISPLSRPSGSPAYIFDETGQLVDWCRDLGDNSSFVNKWGTFSNATPISAEDAKQMVKAHER